MEKSHVVWWVQIYPVSEYQAASGWAERWMKWFLVPIVQACGDIVWYLSLIQLARSWVSNIMCPKKWGQMTTWIYWTTRFFHQWIFAFWHKHIPRWNSGDSSGSNCKRVVQTWIGHRRVQNLTPLRTSGMWWTLRSGPTLPSSIQGLGEKWMQLWTWMNVVTFHKLNQMMPQQMQAMTGCKGGSTKY